MFPPEHFLKLNFNGATKGNLGTTSAGECLEITKATQSVRFQWIVKQQETTKWNSTR